MLRRNDYIIRLLFQLLAEKKMNRKLKVLRQRLRSE